MATIYKHTSPEGKIYIGISRTDNTKSIQRDRWQSKGQGYKTNIPFWEDIQKFGWDNFKHEFIIQNIESEEELLTKEAEMIRFYNSDNPEVGYNKKMAYRAVICIDTGEIFNSMTEAQKKTGISSACISACCRGKTKTAGKKHWEYLIQEDKE